MGPIRDDDGNWAALEAALRRLPRADPPPALRGRCLPGAVEVGARRVLVVEDEPAIRRLIEVHLSRAGYEVTAAADGREALARLGERRPDLVLLDVVMPGMDGFALLDHLKADPETAAIPVVMLTARSDDDNTRHGWRAGADFYMAKPFNPEELRAVVARFLAVVDTPENPPPLRRWAK